MSGNNIENSNCAKGQRKVIATNCSVQPKDASTNSLQRKEALTSCSVQPSDAPSCSSQPKDTAICCSQHQYTTRSCVPCKGIANCGGAQPNNSLHRTDNSSCCLQNRNTAGCSKPRQDIASCSVPPQDTASCSKQRQDTSNCNLPDKDTTTDTEQGDENADAFEQRPPRLEVNVYHVNLELFCLDVVRMFQYHPYYPGGLQECHILDLIKSHGVGNGDVALQLKVILHGLARKGFVQYVNGAYRYLGPYAALASARNPRELSRQWLRLNIIDGAITAANQNRTGKNKASCSNTAAAAATAKNSCKAVSKPY